MSGFAAYLPGFIAAYSILVVAAASPGPAVAMLLGVAQTEGRRDALVAALGIAAGSATINVATLLGVGLILSQAAWAMGALRLIGAGYLLWLAFGAFRKAVHPPRVNAREVRRRSLPRRFLSGYLLQVTNPKAVIFWLAIASVGAAQGGGLAVASAFVIGAFVISLLAHVAWALLLSSAPIRRGYAAGRRWIEAGLGAFFVIAAWKLASAR
ncbi:LysE family translocator [Roseovarius nanhaiticus]|uniref:LysE family translocator n=1 Tax=Roseovarius nanhaiticus TaxID=573024 RepID=UPI0024921865|nr:LysE family translocator [Roseovarius nanhaiticus]